MDTTPNIPLPPIPTGTGPTATGDMRAHFESLSQQNPRDPKSELAFLNHRIEMIRTDPHLSDAQKEQAIADIRQRLKSQSE